ncbi:MAG: redoxin family protein [Gemmatimonadaceae bacterium]
MITALPRAPAVFAASVLALVCPVFAVAHAQADSPVRDEAAEIARSVAQTLNGRHSAGDARNMERQVYRLDSLPASVDDEKLIAHGVMVEYYEHAGLPDLMRYHARAMIELSQGLDPIFSRLLAPLVFRGYRALADLAAREGHASDAAATLNAMSSDIARDSRIAPSLASTLGRYSLVGKQAPALNPPSWINDTSPSIAPDLRSPSATGRHTTVIEFTTWKCDPCQQSYEYLRTVGKHFATRSVNVVLVTGTMGSFRNATHLTRADEISKLRDYFIKEEHLPFPVGVTDGQGPLQPAYYVDAYPELVVVDGNGVVRTVLHGWNGDSGDILTKSITSALQ